MMSFIGLGIGLGVVFGCLLLAFVAELYYLLWWKKRIVHNNTESEEDEYNNNYAKELVQLLCWKRPISPQRNQDPDGNTHGRDLEVGSNKELQPKPFLGEEGVEAELMRLHNLSGPPRFLFTIKEETKEDLESEDGRSRSRKGSKSDILVTLETPFLTPMASPRINSPLGCYFNNGFNPLFESTSDFELRMVKSSPPPTFKFLRDAEEKLLKRLKEGERKKEASSILDEREGSFLKFIVSKNKEREQLQQVTPQTSSQVLPLASSPTKPETHLTN